MRNFKYVWVIGLLGTFLLVMAPLVLLMPAPTQAVDNPWEHVPERLPVTDHSALIKGPFTTGSEVTLACLTCHPNAAGEVIQTTHWTWKAAPVQVEGRDEPVAIGKANLLNNYCIGIQSNETVCTRCHAGYGWSDASFDFSNQANVDCLVCHDQSGGYQKAASGLPAEGVDLVAAAQSVGIPTRENCGGCHFNGGGGNAVKHGDLDESLYFPSPEEDVHMGRLDFQCVDCHQTEHHLVSGRAMSVSVETITNRIACTDCHNAETTHQDERIVAHLDTLACQTCHIPYGATREATKMSWDWSTAGQDWPESPHEYLKIKGSFVYEGNFTPDYAWFNGYINRYLLGDPIDPTVPTVLNLPMGDINDPNARIWPFKIHVGNQIYDTVYNYLLQPKTVGEYWVNFDWNVALQKGSEATGLPYSGSYGFAPTTMYWNLSHLVVPSENALQCTECHGENSRMDWQALGYYGDPMIWGGR